MSTDHTVYTVHPPLRRQDFTVSLEEGAITMKSEKGKEKRILFSEIIEINVSYMGEGMYRCLVKNKVDDRIVFPSHTSEDKDRKSQLHDFCAFVMELHTMTAQYQGGILFTQGHPFLFYLAVSIMTISALIIVSVFPLMLLAGRELTSNLNTSLIISLTVLILIGGGIVYRVKPKIYNPAQGVFPYDIDTIANLIKKSETITESPAGQAEEAE